MKNYISLNPVNSQEVAGLINAICKQLDIPCNGMNDLCHAYKQKDFINDIASKQTINIRVENKLYEYGIAINQIADILVSRNILDECVLEQDLKEFLLLYPLLRI